MTNRAHIYVLADDLTGSADAANYFRVGDSRVRVTYPRRTPWDFTLGAEVAQVYDAESRMMTPQEAAQAVYAASREIQERDGHAMVYKKMDSTLRGHIGAEIDAALTGLGRQMAIVAPTFPANGRALVNGCLYVHHVPVDKTAFADDPLHPIRNRSVREQIQQTTSLLIRELTLSIIRTSTDAIQTFLHDIKSTDEPTIVVADAETEDDLTRLADAIAWRPDVLPCGSAGLAKSLAALWLQEQMSNVAVADPPASAQPCANRIMVMVGSANATSHQQTQLLAESSAVDSIVIQSSALVDSTLRDGELERVQQRIKSSKATTLLISMSQERVHPSRIQVPLVTDMARVAGPVLFEWMEGGNDPIAVVATGGDTALALCNELDVSSIWPEGELFPGVPWSIVEGEQGKLTLISKAGGFGSPTVLRDAVRKLITR